MFVNYIDTFKIKMGVVSSSGFDSNLDSLKICGYDPLRQINWVVLLYFQNNNTDEKRAYIVLFNITDVDFKHPLNWITRIQTSPSQRRERLRSLLEVDNLLSFSEQSVREQFFKNIDEMFSSLDLCLTDFNMKSLAKFMEYA